MQPQTTEDRANDIWHKIGMAKRTPKSDVDKTRALLIGSRIRQLREQKQYTQQELADKVGLTSGAIGQYETGRNLPRFKRLERLAAEFGVTTEWLMTGDDPEETEKAQTTAEREALHLLRAIPVNNHDAALAMLRGLAHPKTKE